MKSDKKKITKKIITSLSLIAGIGTFATIPLLTSKDDQNITLDSNEVQTNSEIQPRDGTFTLSGVSNKNARDYDINQLKREITPSVVNRVSGLLYYTKRTGEEIRNFSVTVTNDSNYEGKLRVSGTCHYWYSHRLTNGQLVEQWYDQPFGMDVAGYHVWNTTPKGSSMQAPAGFKKYYLGEAEAKAKEYVTTHINEFINDAPIDASSNILFNSAKPNAARGSLTISFRLNKTIVRGRVSNSAQTYTIELTGFLNQGATNIGTIKVGNIGKGLAYNEANDSERIKKLALDQINANRQGYNVPLDAKIIDLKIRPGSIDEQALGNLIFDAKLDKQYNEIGQVSQNPYSFTVEATGFKIYNTTIIATSTDQFTFFDSSVRIATLTTNLIQKEAYDLVKQGKIFGGETRKISSFSDIDAKSVRCEISSRDFSGNFITLRIQLNPALTWIDGKPTETPLDTIVTITGFAVPILGDENSVAPKGTITGSTFIIEEENGLPYWAWILIALGAIIVIITVALLLHFLVFKKKGNKKTKEKKDKQKLKVENGPQSQLAYQGNRSSLPPPVRPTANYGNNPGPAHNNGPRSSLGNRPTMGGSFANNSGFGNASGPRSQLGSRRPGGFR